MSRDSKKTKEFGITRHIHNIVKDMKISPLTPSFHLITVLPIARPHISIALSSSPPLTPPSIKLMAAARFLSLPSQHPSLSRVSTQHHTHGSSKVPLSTLPAPIPLACPPSITLMAAARFLSLPSQHPSLSLVSTQHQTHGSSKVPLSTLPAPISLSRVHPASHSWQQQGSSLYPPSTHPSRVSTQHQTHGSSKVPLSTLPAPISLACPPSIKLMAAARFLYLPSQHPSLSRVHPASHSWQQQGSSLYPPSTHLSRVSTQHQTHGSSKVPLYPPSTHPSRVSTQHQTHGSSKVPLSTLPAPIPLACPPSIKLMAAARFLSLPSQHPSLSLVSTQHQTHGSSKVPLSTLPAPISLSRVHPASNSWQQQGSSLYPPSTHLSLSCPPSIKLMAAARFLSLPSQHPSLSRVHPASNSWQQQGSSIYPPSTHLSRVSTQHHTHGSSKVPLSTLPAPISLACPPSIKLMAAARFLSLPSQHPSLSRVHPASNSWQQQGSSLYPPSTHPSRVSTQHQTHGSSKVPLSTLPAPISLSRVHPASNSWQQQGSSLYPPSTHLSLACPPSIKLMAAARFLSLPSQHPSLSRVSTQHQTHGSSKVPLSTLPAPIPLSRVHPASHSWQQQGSSLYPPSTHPSRVSTQHHTHGSSKVPLSTLPAPIPLACPPSITLMAAARFLSLPSQHPSLSRVHPASNSWQQQGSSLYPPSTHPSRVSTQHQTHGSSKVPLSTLPAPISLACPPSITLMAAARSLSLPSQHPSLSRVSTQHHTHGSSKVPLSTLPAPIPLACPPSITLMAAARFLSLPSQHPSLSRVHPASHSWQQQGSSLYPPSTHPSRVSTQHQTHGSSKVPLSTLPAPIPLACPPSIKLMAAARFLSLPSQHPSL